MVERNISTWWYSSIGTNWSSGRSCSLGQYASQGLEIAVSSHFWNELEIPHTWRHFIGWWWWRKSLNPIQLAKERLLSVELAIERRYLKAPLGHSKGDLVQSVLSGSCPSSEPPKALLTWREAVKRCETAAQVSMCFYVLETSVAWDKSIMKASCQFCHSGDKEDQLLLCDGCDKGYHTYCFRPPMDNIPDGDWFCYECRNKATGQRNCIVCGKPGNKSISVLCDQCPKAYHIECLQPPLAKV